MTDTSNDGTERGRSPETDRRTTRRSVLRSGAVLGGAVLGGGALAGGGAVPSSAATPADASTDAERRVVSYYTGWSRYDRDFQPADVPLDPITDLYYAFLTVEADGTVAYADSWGDQENLAAFREIAREHPETRFHLSIGGWNDSTYFSDAAATAEDRERFASTAIELLREYGFDGLDVDWEYPGGGGAPGNVTREDDPENFALLLEEVRSQLDAAGDEDDAEYELSIAASANPDVAGALPVESIAPHVDVVTVMAYDYAGSWSDATGHNAPLHADGLSVAESMAWWAEQPIPREKLCVGLPFYGHAFDGVEPAAGGTGDGSGDDAPDGLGQPFDGVETVLYRDLDESYPLDGGYERFWDDEAAVPYRYSADDATFVSYDDAESIARKAEFAATEAFGGVTIWEQAGDPDGELLAVVDEHLHGGDVPEDCAAALDVDGRTVCDLDGDGAYRDVTGDGDLGQDDVVAFFERQHRSAWKRDAFDFSGNGEVNQFDVVELFEHVLTS